MREPLTAFNCQDDSSVIIKFLDIEIKIINICPMISTQTHEWQALTELTQGRALVVERVRLAESGVAIEGAFALPRLAQLAMEDQVFIAAFLRSHGSIKEMEQVFGVSYPTIKARLNRLAASLEFIDIEPAPARSEVLERLARGELTADQAVRELENAR